MRPWVPLSLLSLLAACAPAPRDASQVDDGMAAFLVWDERPVAPAQALAGEVVDELAVAPGQVWRLETDAVGELPVTEVAKSPTGVVEVSHLEPVREGTAYVRTGALTEALRFPAGVVRHAYAGHASDPGTYWTSHEERVVAWAEGPLPAPFPAVAPSSRLDGPLLQRLDATLATAVERAPRAPTARPAANAIRAIVGLRQVRALRPLSGFPYFRTSRALAEDAAPAGTRDGREVHALSPTQSLEAHATGPAVLAIWGWSSARGPGKSVSLEVFEGPVRRAATQRRLPQTPAPPGAAPSAERLSRLIVHVPPGPHVYRITASDALDVAATVAEPVLPLALRHRADEAALLGTALEACSEPALAAICRLAHALAPPAEPLAMADDAVGRLVHELASGHPLDAGLDPEAGAERPDAAWERLAGDVDEATRAAWGREIARATSWQPLPSPPSGRRWIRAFSGESTQSEASAPENEVSSFTDLSATPTTVATRELHGAPAVELLWSGAPSEAPVELEVDGQRLSAQPHAALARWHVRVQGETATLRRLDGGTGRVLVAPPSRHFAEVAASASEEPGALPASPETPRGLGVELWAREDRPLAEVEVTGRGGSSQRVLVRAQGEGAAMAVDEAGHTWRRVGRAALPSWAARGAEVRPGPGTAWRAVVRAAEAPPSAPLSADDAPPVASAPATLEAIMALSRAVLEASETERPARLRERALALASRGLSTAALRDARAAAALGLAPAEVAELEARLGALADRATAAAAPLPPEVKAYGLEPDFDDPRAGAGPRAAFAAALAELPAREGDATPRFDAALASRVIEAARAVPFDPRAERSVRRALAGSRWERSRDFIRALPDLPGAASNDSGGAVVDGNGVLLARVALGMPFAEGTAVGVTPDLPATLRLAPDAAGAQLRLEVMCAATVPDAEPTARCAPRVTLADTPLAPSGDAARGRLSYALPAVRQRTLVRIALDPSPSRWVATVRLVSDRASAGTAPCTAEGCVVLPPRRDEVGWLAPGRRPIATAQLPTVLRLQARVPEGESGQVAMELDGVAHPVPTDGTPLVVGARTPATLVISGGRAAVVVAERVVLSGPPPPRPLDAAPSAPPAPARVPVALVPPSSTEAPSWQRRAEGSPPPLGALASNLGTLVATSGVTGGTLREGAPTTDPSWFAFEALDYRRRIERLQLWTTLGGFARLRPSAPTTFGAQAALYEDLSALHLRLATSLRVESQEVGDGNAVAWLSRGFVEYRFRATPTLFLLPRVGWDQVDFSLDSRPRVVPTIDHEVYSSYRRKRPTFVFAQGLVWWAPYFDALGYLRARVTADAGAGTLARASLRPGAHALFGAVDVAAYLDAAWIPASQTAEHSARLEPSVGGAVRFDRWWGLGSVDLQPGVSGSAQGDGDWQLNAFVSLLLSRRRGLRDFSPPEVDFPEQRSGGIPWRGATPGGYR